jgi:hypothetical protein
MFCFLRAGRVDDKTIRGNQSLQTAWTTFFPLREENDL